MQLYKLGKTGENITNLLSLRILLAGKNLESLITPPQEMHFSQQTSKFETKTKKQHLSMA